MAMNRKRGEEGLTNRLPVGEGDPQSVEEEKESDSTPGRSKRPPYRNPGLIVLILVLLVGAIFGFRYYLHARGIESTDDAFIEGHVIQISPKVAGHVIEVQVKDNQEVKKGDLLVTIDPRDFEVGLDQARAGEASARSKLKQAETQLPVARAALGQAEAEVQVAETNTAQRESDRRRVEQLGELASRKDLDDAIAAARNARSQLIAAQRRMTGAAAQVTAVESQIRTAQAEVDQASVAIQQAELQLSYTKVFAAEEGRVTRKSVESGMFIQPGQALMAIVPREVWVVANFKETQLTQMRPGQPVEIRVDAYPDRRFKGHIDSIQAGSGARFSLLPPENATGNFVKVVQRIPVKILFDGPTDPGILLAPGMSAQPEVRIK